MTCTSRDVAVAEPLRPADYTVEWIDTAYAPGEPSEYWVEHVRTNHGSLQLHFADPPVFRGGTVVQRNATHQLVDFWSDALRYVRTDADVKADDRQGNLLLVARHGVLEVEQSGVQMRLVPGQAAVLTKARPLQVRHAFGVRGWTFEATDVSCPAAMDRHPTVVDLRNGLGSVVFSMLSTVSQQHRTLDSYQFTRSCTTLTDLLIASMLERCGLPDTLNSVEHAVRQYVTAHSRDPELSPRAIAAALGWSVRQIQLALQQAGTTTSELIRSARVNRAADLLRGSSPGTTITSIAFESGFRSMSTFEAVFKQHFGVTPREARALAHQPVDDVRG
ncbi:hypothetical protein A5714_13140 [Mycobacterium sp. E2462]|uniref:AraC family transcriptional regulator n=2 Tax=Mycobacterium TaxID=1763 RepID=UPI0008010F38|nr:AraC family transcriptional regulator [Mycobacterium sp. E2462]OBI14725.1 hypothetical protein A5714_13140 [Mycobacterium sp. E2462]